MEKKEQKEQEEKKQEDNSSIIGINQIINSIENVKK